MREKELLDIINDIRMSNGEDAVKSISGETSLRRDLRFDSIDFATLTVRIEDACGVDIFEDGIVDTFGEILDKVK